MIFSLDFKSDKFISNKSNVLLFDNIVGEDLFNVIKYAHIVVSFHGMMTNLASLLKKPVLDLWHCRINSWEDYRKYRNAEYAENTNKNTEAYRKTCRKYTEHM